MCKNLVVGPLHQLLLLSHSHMYDYRKEAKVGVEGQQPVFTHLHSFGPLKSFFTLSHSSMNMYDYRKEAKVGVEGQQLVFTHLNSFGPFFNHFCLFPIPLSTCMTMGKRQK